MMLPAPSVPRTMPTWPLSRARCQHDDGADPRAVDALAVVEKRLRGARIGGGVAGAAQDEVDEVRAPQVGIRHADLARAWRRPISGPRARWRTPRLSCRTTASPRRRRRCCRCGGWAPPPSSARTVLPSSRRRRTRASTWRWRQPKQGASESCASCHFPSKDCVSTSYFLSRRTREMDTFYGLLLFDSSHWVTAASLNSPCCRFILCYG